MEKNQLDTKTSGYKIMAFFEENDACEAGSENFEFETFEEFKRFLIVTDILGVTCSDSMAFTDFVEFDSIMNSDVSLNIDHIFEDADLQEYDDYIPVIKQGINHKLYVDNEMTFYEYTESGMKPITIKYDEEENKIIDLIAKTLIDYIRDEI